MRLFSNALLSLSGLVAALASSASAGYLLPIVPVAGSVAGGTGVFGITDNKTIVGSWFDANNVEHGYFGTLAGKYTTFDAGPGGTEPRGINNRGAIVGYYNTSATVNGGQEFERRRRGAFIDIKKSGANLTGILQGINNTRTGAFVGDYYQVDASGNFTGVRFAYRGDRGHWVSDIPLPATQPKPSARGINNLDLVVGYFVVDSVQHGFIRHRNTRETQIDYPDPDNQGTILESVNDAGLAVGQWTDSAGNSHSFTYDIRSMTFTPINVPGATNVQAFGLNNAGMISINTDTSAFIYCPHAHQCRGGGQRRVIRTTGKSIVVPLGTTPVHVAPGTRSQSPATTVPPNSHWRLYAKP